MIWNWIKRRYTERMEEDEKKVEDKVAWLNKHHSPAKWDSVAGFASITSVDLKGDKPDFNIGKGIPLKAFYNSETGEIKTFYAGDFVKGGTIS